ncbi:MAG: DUF4956 domain-containing protein [Kofleriaceae bacterium]|jgi:hypothetical protein|nr:DUF4956 domain-containing protein [Kofleriaceae bacterium]MBP6836021.1 DUF4956 domain-containing protein [Kofleriaceae bacterium]MBP9203950.1 DUF4956 domain-containing protein [Kofleriaceae bacterium]
MNLTELLGTDSLIDSKDLLQLLVRLGFNLVVTSAIVGLYYRLYRNREFVFTYFVFNVITFTLCASLRKVPIELGFALGLFAVFGILRYRTEEIKLRDLNYQFVVIGIGILNAVANKKVSFAELVAVNLIVAGMCFVLELMPSMRHSRVMPVFYDNLALLHPGKEAALHADLGQRLGVTVTRVAVHRIDTLRDAAEVTVFYTLADAAAAPTSTPGASS